MHRPHIRIVFAALALAAAPLHAQVTLYWDPDGVGAASGGNGTWEFSGPFWTMVAAPDAVNGNYQEWGNGTTVANFPAGAYSVNLGIDVVAGHIVAGGTTLFLNGHTLSLGSNNTDSSLAGAYLTGAGKLIKTGTGALTLGSPNDHTGGTDVLGGAIVASSNAALGTNASTLTLNNGTLRLGGSFTFADARSVVLTNTATIDTNGFDLSRNVPFSGSGTLVKNGNGSLTLNATNTQAGSAVLNGGLLVLGANNALGGSITINGGNIRAGGAERTLTNSITLNGSFTLGRVTNFAGPIALGNDLTITSGNPDVSPPTNTSTLSGVISGNKSLTFQDGANPTGTVALSGANTYSGTTTLTSGNLRLGHALALQGSTFIPNGGALSFGSLTAATFGGLSGSQNLALTNATPAAVALSVGANNSSTTYSGVLSGTGSLNKVGTGVLTLSGNNTYSGGTTVAGGLIRFSSAASFGSGSISLNGGGLQWPSGNTTDITTWPQFNFTLSNGGLHTNGNDVVLAGRLSGPLNKSGGGVLTLSGLTDNVAMTAVVSEGVLDLAKTSSASVHAIGTAGTGLTIQSGATVRLAGTGDDQIYTQASVNIAAGGLFDLKGHHEGFNNLTGAGAVVTSAIGLTSMLTLGQDHGSGTFSGTIQDGYGKVALTKTGTGTLTLSGSNTYTGGTTIQAGTVQLGKQNALSSTAPIVVNSGGTLNIGTFNQLVGPITGNGAVALGSLATLTLFVEGVGFSPEFSGIISGSGGLTKSGSATIVLSGPNTYTGTTTVNQGTVQMPSLVNLGTGPIAINNGGRLQWTNVDSVGFRSISINAGGATFDTNGHEVYLSQAPFTSGVLTKTGGGTLSIGGYFSSTGIIVSGGTMRFTDDVTGSITNNSSVVFDGYDLEYGGNMSGTGSLTVPVFSSTHLTGNNSHAGGTWVEGILNAYTDGSVGPANGVLTLGGGTLRTSSSFTSTRPTTLAGGGYFETAGGTTLTWSGVISSSSASSLTKVGDGTLVLGGANTYSGNTNVDAGTLRLAGSLAAGSTLTVNSGATLAGTGTSAKPITLNSGGTVAPGATGIGTLNGTTMTWNGGGNLAVDLGATADRLNLTGSLAKGAAGTYNFVFTGTPFGGNKFTVISAASTTFSAANFSAPGFAGHFSVSGGDVIFHVGAQPGLTYAAWSANLPAGKRGANDDADADGVPNGIEFVLCTDPSAPTQTALQLLTVNVSGTNYPAVSYTRRNDLNSVSADIDVASNANFTAPLGSTQVSVTALPDGLDQVVVRSTQSLTAQPRQFFRLRATVP